MPFLIAWALTTNGFINMLWSIGFIVGVPLFADRVLVGNVGAYGLIIGAYGVGNILSNLFIGSIRIRHRVAMIFVGKIVLGVGFLLVATARTLPIAMLGSAIAALGGPIGDIMTMTMLQTDLPVNQLGKVYSLRMVLASVGGSLGLLLAVPLFAQLSVPISIAICAFLMIVTGIAGLVRFGFTEPQTARVYEER